MYIATQNTPVVKSAVNYLTLYKQALTNYLTQAIQFNCKQ